MPITKAYLGICMPALPLYFLTIVFMRTIRVEGRPQWAMIAGALVNVVLDWYFIARLNMGVAGAAWGTIIAQAAAFLWVGFFYARRRGALGFLLGSLRPRWAVLRETLSVGASTFLFRIFLSVSMGVINMLLRQYGGGIAVSAMGIFLGLNSFLFMPVSGICVGCSPLIGYNYGGHNFSRLRRTVKITMMLAVGYCTLSTVLTVFWAEAFAAPFSKGNDELLRIAARSLRIGYASLPFSGVCLISISILESLELAKTACCFNLVRQLSLISVLLVLPRFLGVDGVWLTFFVTAFAEGVGGALLVKWHLVRLGVWGARAESCEPMPRLRRLPPPGGLSDRRKARGRYSGAGPLRWGSLRSRSKNVPRGTFFERENVS